MFSDADADQYRMITNDLKQISNWFESQSHANTLANKFSYGSCTGQRHYSIDHRSVSLQIICENEIRSKNIAGLGGSGGLGGNFGQIVVIGFEQQPKVCTIQHAGK